MHDALIIGAGISGLSCARELKSKNLNIIVLEKSRSLGGRCATRRWRNHKIDHGAQYITAQSPEFASLLKHQGNWHTIPNALFQTASQDASDNKQRLYHSDGNRALGEFLATDITVIKESTVESIEPKDGGFLVSGHAARTVIITTPLPQAEKILGQKLGHYEIQPCLTAFCAYPKTFAGNTAQHYAKKLGGHDCEWSACENHKIGRITADETIMVYQASPAFSHSHIEDHPDTWLPLLRKKIEPHWQLDATPPTECWTHRWRYARTTTPLAAPPALPQGIFLAGDGLTQSRVESAWLSGRTTAQAVSAFCRM